MLCVAMVMTACSSVDCPLNNTVYANYKLMGKVTKLPEVLTISTIRNNAADTILLNQKENTDSFSLPVSYTQDEDILVFQTNTARDTVWIKKTNQPHFESVDCGLNYFHTLTGIKSTRNAIDSVVINNKEVTYDATKQHIYIYFKEFRF